MATPGAKGKINSPCWIDILMELIEKIIIESNLQYLNRISS